MENLEIPTRLSDEFVTVKALLDTKGETRGLDALILSWVKYEKQFRRLFSFLVYQHEWVTAKERKAIDDAIIGNDRLYPYSLTASIQRIGGRPISELVGEPHDGLAEDIKRIGDYRDKIMHGQLSGDSISRAQLIGDAQILIDWIKLLGDGAEKIHGYDGVERDTFCLARERPRLDRGGYQYETLEVLTAWIREINKLKKRRGNPVEC